MHINPWNKVISINLINTFNNNKSINECLKKRNGG